MDAALPHDVSGVQPVSTSRFTDKLLLSAWQCPCTARSDAQEDRFVRAGHLPGRRGREFTRSPAEDAENVPSITEPVVIPVDGTGQGFGSTVPMNTANGTVHGEYKVPGGKLVVVGLSIVDGRLTAVQARG